MRRLIRAIVNWAYGCNILFDLLTLSEAKENFALILEDFCDILAKLRIPDKERNWKPTDEQLEVLKEAVAYFEDSWVSRRQQTLESLYSDLKAIKDLETNK